MAHLLLAGNNVWCGGGMRCSECPLVSLLFFYYVSDKFLLQFLCLVG